MKARYKQRLLSCAAVLLILALAAAAGMTIRRVFADARQKEARSILYYYSENIMLQLQNSLNETGTLAQMARMMGEDSAWFEEAAGALLEREEVRFVCLIQGDTVVSAEPAAVYGDRTGRDLEDFSYIYTMAKVVKELVVEGPVVMDDDAEGREVFLFVQPLVEDDAYLGEVAVALEFGYVLEQLDLDALSQRGYDYELWRIDSKSGGKEVVAVSRPEVDFSRAAKTAFYLPTQWNLSVQPASGWVSPPQKAALVLLFLAISALLLLLARCLQKLYMQSRILARQAAVDEQTGFHNRRGFSAALEAWHSGGGPATLFYFVFESYNQVSQLIGAAEEEAFLKSIPAVLEGYVESPFLAGRLGAGNFALAVRGEMDEAQQEDFAKGLSLALLLKARLDGERLFLTARYRYAGYEPGRGAEEQIAALIRAYYVHFFRESPARMLTEKCRLLMEGRHDVTFGEYADMDMTELSKTFNRYRKQVERLAYFDPVLGVGNRTKLMQDIETLISYDKKRSFGLFCVDICGFAQYNELFSAAVGDRILQEAVQRLSRPFGANLYRINGDVFVGISLSGEPAEPLAARLQQLFTAPVAVDGSSIALQVRVAVCRYPACGETAAALLDRMQAALRVSKDTGRGVVIYDDQLDAELRKEAEILRRLEEGLQRQTVEVWYQPLLHLETGRFLAAEALTHLPDGQGGFFPAGQVIALAERNGLIERLGDYVLLRACRFMGTRGAGLGLRRMGVNLSVQQLLVEGSAEHLLRLIGTSGISPRQVTLEITESILIQSIERASAALDRLRSAGVRIALDDFGVGYSSLNYLSNLPVDSIKIDRALTRQILTNRKQQALLHAIVGVAELNALTVVAEGVEAGEELEMIAQTGVQYIQGFYYARPMPEESLIRFLNEHNS